VGSFVIAFFASFGVQQSLRTISRTREAHKNLNKINNEPYNGASR
jgi:hypothetical protein